MERTIRTLTVAALAVWSAYLLCISVVLLRLVEWMSPSEAIPGVLLPIGMIAASICIGFWLASKLPARAVVACQALVLVLGSVFLVSLFVARAV